MPVDMLVPAGARPSDCQGLQTVKTVKTAKDEHFMLSIPTAWVGEACWVGEGCC